VFEGQHPQFSLSGATGPRVNERALDLTRKGHVARGYVADLSDASAVAALVTEVQADFKCVAPGWVATGSHISEEARAALHTPIGRAGTPTETVTAIAFLALPGASYITGHLVVVDGGNCLQERKG
jgi:hypothetical protein